GAEPPLFARSSATLRSGGTGPSERAGRRGRVVSLLKGSGDRVEAGVAGQLLQLQQRVLLDLTDALARQAVLLADLRQGALAAVLDAVAHLDDGGGALVQTADQVVELLAAQQRQHRLLGRHGGGVLQEVAELRLAVVVDRHVQRDRVTGPVEHVGDALRRGTELGGDLGGLRGPSVLAVELALHPTHPAQLLHQVHGEADGAGLVGYRARDGLTDPPRGVRRELEALAVVELLDGTHQTGVALLDQVEQRQAAARVTARDGDDQPEVGADEDVLGPLAVVDQGLELLGGGSDLVLLLPVQDLPGEHTRLDDLRALDLLGGVAQRCARDLVEVHAYQVAVGDLAAVGANTACRGDRLAGGGLTTGDGAGCHACSLAMVRSAGGADARTPLPGLFGLCSGALHP